MSESLDVERFVHDGFTALAAEDLLGGRAACIVDASAEHADNTNSTRQEAQGIVSEDADEGDSVFIVTQGWMRKLTWTWTPQRPIYLTAAGVLTQTIPAIGFLQQLAFAHTATVIFVDIRPALDREERIVLPFGWGDASPEIIGVVPAGRTVKRVELHITTAFNGTGAALSVGRSGAAEELMAQASNIPSDVGTYHSHPNVKYVSDTTTLLTITPGTGASTGAGFVVITFTR